MSIKKLGKEAIEYILKKVLTKKGVQGITTIPGPAYKMRMKQLVDAMTDKMKNLGYDINKVSEKDVQGLLDSAEALAKQKKTFEMVEVPTERTADVLPFRYKKTFKQEIEEMGKKSEPAPTVGGKTIEEVLGGKSWADRKKAEKVIEKYPLQDIKDRVRPGSMLDDLAKRDPQAVRQHIRNNDITDQHLAFINTGKINYKQMEKLLGPKLKGTETWEELKAIQKRKFPDPPEDLAYGGVAGLLGERQGYEDGREVYLPPIKDVEIGLGFKPDDDIPFGYLNEDIIKQILKSPKKRLKDLQLSILKKNYDNKSMLEFLLGKDNLGFRFSKQFQIPYAYGGIAGMLGEPTYADGGRTGFKGKKFDPKRRTVLKGIAALAALPVIGKYFKWAKPLAKTAKVADLTSVPIKNIKGMPSWFKPLVNKVIKEGDNVTKKFATQERQIVHKTKLPDSKTDVLVTQDLNTGNVSVELGMTKHGFADGHLGQPARLEYRASEDIEPVINSWTGKIKSKGTKTKEEFWVEEAESTGGHPENIKFEDSVFEKFGEHGSNFDEVEKFATGTIKKKTGKASIKAERAHWVPEGDDMASGGLAGMLGE